MSIKTRLEALEEAVPPGIVLTLDDGTKIEDPGPALEFYIEAQEQIRRKRGPLYNAAAHIVSATGFGRLHEVLLAMAEGPVSSKESSTAKRSNRNAGHSSRKRRG